MSKLKKQFVCNVCGAVSPKWSGQCYDCKTWGSIEEQIDEIKKSISQQGKVIKLEEFSEITSEDIRFKTPLSELNRVLGGGLVKGSVILIGGDPGIGKSTLLLQLTMLMGQNPSSHPLYITGEESTNQVKLRANRLGLSGDNARIISATNLADILTTIEGADNKPDMVVIDSIQTMYSDDFSSAPGTVSQIKYVTQQLITYVKKHEVTLLIVGHVTKDGQIAGPKVLEHMMDTVLYFEGDSNYYYRILRSIKNRFGGINEIGVFEMTTNGLVEVSNPSQLFLMNRESNVSGTAVFAGIEGSRPILVEIQALISPSFIPTPRRSVVGWDTNRLSMILAVLNVRYKLNLSAYEVYLSIAGGIKITEPAVDLAVAAAIISASKNKPLPNNSVFFGEIGLSGEVRKASQADLRIREAKKLGYEHVICSSHPNVSKKEITDIAHIKQLDSVI